MRHVRPVRLWRVVACRDDVNSRNSTPPPRFSTITAYLARKRVAILRNMMVLGGISKYAVCMQNNVLHSNCEAKDGTLMQCALRWHWNPLWRLTPCGDARTRWTRVGVETVWLRILQSWIDMCRRAACWSSLLVICNLLYTLIFYYEPHGAGCSCQRYHLLAWKPFAQMYRH